jgi:hypothetical protein
LKLLRNFVFRGKNVPNIDPRRYPHRATTNVDVRLTQPYPTKICFKKTVSGKIVFKFAEAADAAIFRALSFCDFVDAARRGFDSRRTVFLNRVATRRR